MATKKTETKENENLVTEEQPKQETVDVEALKKQIAELEEKLKAAEKVNGVVESPVNIDDPDDEWNQFVHMNVPRHGKGQEKYFYVSVNHRTCQVPADGKYHDIRKPFAEILQMSIEAEAEAERWAEEEVPHEASPEDYAQLKSQMAEMKKLLRAHGID